MKNKLDKEIKSLHSEIESLLKTQKVVCKSICPDADESCAGYHSMEDIINALQDLEIKIDDLMREVNAKEIEEERVQDE